MTNKIHTSLTISDDNVPAILRQRGDEKDLNWQDVPYRDRVKHLRERFWIKESGATKRWKNRQLINAAGWTELRISDLGRKLDDPGDAFYWLFLSTNRYSIHLRTWFEVTEVFLPEQAKKVNRFMREYNGLRGKGKFDADEFLKTLDLGPPDSRMQKDIADSVIAAIKKKAEKGREEGSYSSLVRDYGRGQLIVGLPLWFATLPSDPTDPSMVLKDFFMRLNLGFEAIKHPVLRANWCPFDSIVVLWNPTLAAIDEWAKVTDPGVYSDPANYSLKNPLSFMKGYSFLKDPDFPIPNNIRLSARWDRYSSLNAMLADQRRWLRLPNNPRPLGPKACLDIRKSTGVIESLRTDFYMWVLQLWLYVRGHGWGGLRRRIASKFSVRRLYTHLRLIFFKQRNFIVPHFQIVLGVMITIALIYAGKVAAKRTI